MTRTIQPWDVLQEGDVVIDVDGGRWSVLASDGGVVTVRRPDGTTSRMQSSVLFWRGRKLVRDA